MDRKTQAILVKIGGLPPIPTRFCIKCGEELKLTSAKIKKTRYGGKTGQRFDIFLATICCPNKRMLNFHSKITWKYETGNTEWVRKDSLWWE